MAVPKTQIRVEQLTGSIPDDQVAAAAADVLVLTSLSGTLNHIASSLYRIHGADTFSENATGVIKFADNAASAFAFKESGNAYLEFVTTNSSEAVKISKTLDVDGNLDVDNATTDIVSSGAVSIDGGAASNFTTSAGDLTLQSSAGSVLVTAAEATADAIQLHASNAAGGIDLNVNSTTVVSVDSNSVDVAQQLNVDATTASTSVTTGALVVDGGVGIALDLFVGDDLSLDSDSAVLNIGADNDFSITHDGTTGATLAGNPITITSGGAATWSASAGALTIDAAAAGLVLDGHTGVDIDASNSGVVSIDGAGGINIGIASDTAIDIDSSTLDIDASGNVTIDASGGSISVGTNSSGRAINIGHTTSEVTVNDNLTVTGDLTVNGDTVTVDVATLTVEDPLIKLNKGDTGNPARDQGFIFSRGNGVAADQVNRAFLWDESADEFVLADVTTETGVTSGNVTLADYENLRLGALGVEDTIQIRDTALQISSPQDGSLTVEADGVLLLDCPTSIRFETRDSTEMANNAIDFAAAGEFVTFVSKFSNSTTVMGALNSIGGNRTKVIGKVGEVSGGVTLTGGSEGHNPIAAEASIDLSGLAITMDGANAVTDNNVDVFLNGQLLLSGSTANLTAGAADYNVVDTNSLKFGFILEQGDIVTVVTEG